MKIGVLTSVETRHRYFANRMCEEFRVSAILYEETGYTHECVADDGLGDEERSIVREHFAERDRQEERFFGARSGVRPADNGCAVRRLAAGELNSDETLRFLEAAGVDAVLVFGTNLIKSPLLDRWPGRMINMHLGLSPYYRGTATNFYPLLNEEPEYVGATIHLITAAIDGGPILRHARPTIALDDRPHTIGCKAILAGVEAMTVSVRELDGGTLTPVPQWEVPDGRLYLRKDYHVRQVVELYRKFDAGLISRYLKRAADASPRIRLV